MNSINNARGSNKKVYFGFQSVHLLITVGSDICKHWLGTINIFNCNSYCKACKGKKKKQILSITHVKYSGKTLKATIK